MKGGLKIQSNNGIICTSGFLGRKVAVFDSLRLLTAGHCVEDAGINTIWKHNGVIIGGGSSERFYNGSDADVGTITMSESQARNKVFASDNLDIRSVTGKLTDAQQPDGSTVCRSGRTSGWACDTILDSNVNIPFDGGAVILHHQFVWDHASAGGDSGAPIMNVLTPTKAAGILSGVNESAGLTSYGSIDWIEEEIGWRPCYTSTCN